jgi:hypothetical protein
MLMGWMMASKAGRSTYWPEVGDVMKSEFLGDGPTARWSTRPDAAVAVRRGMADDGGGCAERIAVSGGDGKMKDVRAMVQ